MQLIPGVGQAVGARPEVFDWLRRPKETAEDPEFGPMTLDAKTGWEGKVLFAPTGQFVHLSLPIGAASTIKEHHAAFGGLVRSYEDLRPAIGEALFQLFAPSLQEWDETDQNVPRTPQEMLNKTTLWGIELQPGASELLFAFVPEVGWDDAMFSVVASNGAVAPRSLDD